jgi:glycosyltransferase involved in cell wall biosynthesis
LILGVSGALYLPILKRTTKARIITNIDGMEWKRDKWSSFARTFLQISEKFAVRFSDSVIADNQGIANYVEQKYKTNTHVIPYGGDHAIRENEEVKLYENYALSLCRIEPENNIEMILEAFSKTNYRLKFIGNWDNSEYGKNLKQTFKKFDNIELIDPIYDLERLFIIRNNSDFYVHGHSAGGTNPSLVEMMHFGIEIYAFDCNYNRFTTENKAKFFNSAAELKKLIGSQKEHKALINRELKEIASRRYTWTKITKQYLNIFQV